MTTFSQLYMKNHMNITENSLDFAPKYGIVFEGVDYAISNPPPLPQKQSLSKKYNNTTISFVKRFIYAFTCYI